MARLYQSFWGTCLIWLFLHSPAWGASPGKVPVAASIIPLGDFCQKVGGERVEVQVLLPPGASPHLYEPSPAEMAKAQAARLLVYVGAGLDPFAERFLQSRGSRDLAVVQAVEGINLLTQVDFPPHEHPGEHAHGEEVRPDKDTKGAPSAGKGPDQGQGNPHVWLDPIVAQSICRRLAAALIKIDPSHRSAYEANLERYLAALEDLHREIAGKAAAFRLKEYVCFHPAFSYFARRYGLKEVGVIEPSPGREPSPRHIQRIVQAIRKSGVKAVFAEPQLSLRVAEVIAREAGAKVLILDPLGGRPPYGTDYLKLMRYNLSILEQALQ